MSGQPSKEVTFYYDFSSPYTYLGSTQIDRVAAQAGAVVKWHPMLLGAVFKALTGPNVPLASYADAKRRYMGRDLLHWADHWGVPFRWPSRFPMRTVAPLRLVLAVEARERVRLSHAIFRAYWVEDRDIADPGVLAGILAEQGIANEAIGRIERPEIKAELIALTEAALAAGVFGAPTFIVGEHLFCGQDRLDLVARTLAGWEPPTE